VDLFSPIKSKIEAQIFVNILQRTAKREDMYFIELKVQNHDGSKVKLYPNTNIRHRLTTALSVHTSFVKLDYVVRLDNIFTELSIIYDFDKVKPKEEAIQSLKEDITELLPAHKYYKVLKKWFAIFKLRGRKRVLVQLSRLFNSKVGELYKKSSNLKAIQLVLQHYTDALTLKKIRINLKDLHLQPNISMIQHYIDGFDTIINEEGRVMYRYLKANKELY